MVPPHLCPLSHTHTHTHIYARFARLDRWKTQFGPTPTAPLGGETSPLSGLSIPGTGIAGLFLTRCARNPAPSREKPLPADQGGGGDISLPPPPAQPVFTRRIGPRIVREECYVKRETTKSRRQPAKTRFCLPCQPVNKRAR